MKELKKNTSLSFEEFSKLVNSIILTENGNCPVTPVISMLQGKWKMQIIYELCIKSPMRFGELKKMLGNVTNTALTNALRELEENELIHREQFNEIPPHVEYSLTDKGKDLLPVFHAIANWGLKYIS
ncbi:MAG: helix-turn-helix transcriptional regulator [Butyrivibrio sp.]|jgi:DNA-binding HxlR family transcriptional regulator|nr:helix-turn-helix transcriptional regulator [Butyrivibrio sp.]